jgi:Crp-like helix-turn-helix domain
VIALAERRPAFIKQMALMIGRRLCVAHDSVASLAVDRVEAGVAAALLLFAKREGTHSHRGVTLPFHLTRQSLADMTGTTVETAIRILSRWTRDGVLDDDGGRLVLTDWEGPSAMAEGEAEKRDPTSPAVHQDQLVFLLAGLLIGAYIVVSQFVLDAYPSRLLITAHAHLLLVGFMLMMVMGVATWLFPRPARDDTRYRPELAEAVYCVMAPVLILERLPVRLTHHPPSQPIALKLKRSDGIGEQPQPDTCDQAIPSETSETQEIASERLRN